MYGLRLLLDPRVRRRVLLVVLAIVVVFRVAQLLFYSTQIHWGYDFSAYWQAGRNLLEGASPYAPEQLAGPYSPQEQFRFLYPPFLAVLIAPLTAIIDEYRAANWIWAGLGATLAAAAVLALARRESIGHGRDRWLLVGAAFAFPPVVGDLIMGNVHLLLLGLLTGAWLALRSGSSRGDLIAGALVAAAALIKVFPALVILWFLISGRHRAAAWSITWLVAMAALTLPFSGARPWLDYPIVLLHLGQPVDTHDLLAPTVWLAEVLPFSLARIAISLLGLALVAWSARRHPPAVSYGVVVTVSILIAPALYPHYLAILLLPLLLGLAHGAPLGLVAIAYLGMFGGDPEAMGEAIWIVNRLVPSIGALLVVGVLLAAARSRPPRAVVGSA